MRLLSNAAPSGCGHAAKVSGRPAHMCSVATKGLISEAKTAFEYAHHRQPRDAGKQAAEAVRQLLAPPSRAGPQRGAANAYGEFMRQLLSGRLIGLVS